MKLDQEKICHCSKSFPMILNGSLSDSPLSCIQCKNSIPLDDLNIPTKLALATSQWQKLYNSLYILLYGNIEYYEWAKSKLLDETGFINMEGLRLSQQYNAIRKCYYWMFQDINDKDYRQVQECPFCGASMEPIENNNFKVCHDCMVAYPNSHQVTLAAEVLGLSS